MENNTRNQTRDNAVDSVFSTDDAAAITTAVRAALDAGVSPGELMGEVDRRVGYGQALTTPEEPATPTQATTDTETFETIHYTADVVATTPDGHVLLIERDWPPYEGTWALPGGHVAEGETSRAAAARELTEETGVQIAPADLRQIGVFDRPDRDPRGRYVTVAYLAEVPTGTPATAGGDARTARWWHLNALPPLAFDHDHILHAATH